MKYITCQCFLYILSFAVVHTHTHTHTHTSRGTHAHPTYKQKGKNPEWNEAVFHFHINLNEITSTFTRITQYKTMYTHFKISQSELNFKRHDLVLIIIFKTWNMHTLYGTPETTEQTY